jgi:hypothetical protein
LYAARPSPFGSATSIRFDLAGPSWVTLEIFDVQGRKVATLAEGFRTAGRHDVTWQGRGVAAGVYLVRLRAGNFSRARRLVLVR